MRALKLLNTLFSPTVLPDEKKRILSKKYNIVMTVELESEVQRMCNLGTAIESKARDEGRVEGRAEGRNEGGGCGRFLGPELSNSKTASILHWTQTPQRQFDPFISIPLHILVYNADKFFY